MSIYANIYNWTSLISKIFWCFEVRKANKYKIPAKIYKKLKNFNLNIVETVGYSFFMCVVFELERENFDIKEIPITFYERSSGISKIPKIEILRTLKNLFLNWIKKYLKK